MRSPRHEQTEVERELSRPPGSVRTLLRVKRYEALRRAYRVRFPGILYRLGKKAPEGQLMEWWREYVLDNTIRGDWMRDGWLSGVDYWDC